MSEPFKAWSINLDEKTATDNDGLVVKFAEPAPGTLEGEIENPEKLENENDSVALIQDAARALLLEMKKKRDSAT